MTDQEKQRIAVMRSVGESYKEIAKTLNLSLNTVQTFCRRNMLTGKRAGSFSLEDLSIGNTNANKTSVNLENTGVSRRQPTVKVKLEFADEPDETAIRDVLRMLMEGRQ